ncbi:MAG: ExbD/TolR family protein [Hasllibacter sp.]
MTRAGTLALPPARRARRPGLTPMIDVIFLLLVFFMLASRFGTEAALDLGGGPGTGEWTGPPRLVTVTGGGVLVNGAPAPDPAAALAPLMAGPADPVVLRAAPGVPLQRLIDVAAALRGAGLTALVLAE